MRAALLAKAQQLQQIRRLIPVGSIPGIVQRRVDKYWALPAFRAQCEGQMQYLLEHTERAADAPDLARGYAEQMMLRSYLRWHPRAITHQPVRGIEWLTTKRDPERGIVLSFMHHARYDGMFASVKHAGAPLTLILSPAISTSDTAVGMKQHKHVMCLGGPWFPTTIGTDAIAELLVPGATVAIASDVPSRTPVTFLGREVLGSFGAPRIATMTNSQVVIVTSHRDADGGSHLQLHEPLEPKDHDDPRGLLEEILRIHGEAVLAWPEAFEVPRARFGVLEA